MEEGRERGTARIPERAQCEMIMMIGLPGSGKTTWVTDHVEKNPEKRYNVIGTSALIERMKVGTLISKLSLLYRAALKGSSQVV